MEEEIEELDYEATLDVMMDIEMEEWDGFEEE